MANTKAIADTAERKKVKRTARKKAAPKAKRTVPRGSNKQRKEGKKLWATQEHRSRVTTFATLHCNDRAFEQIAPG